MISTNMEIVGWFYTLCFAICYIPQIVKTLKTKKVEDISISLFTLSIIGYSSALVYCVTELNAPLVLVVNYIFGGICSLTMIILYYLYRSR